MKKVCTIIFVLIVAAVIAFFCADSASATTIKEGYVGIVLNWGKAEADVLTPGFYALKSGSIRTDAPSFQVKMQLQEAVRPQ